MGIGIKTALFWMRALSTGHIGIQGANPLILEDSHWLLLWKAFAIGPMPAISINKLESGEEQHQSI
jgi:hypothetical protein